MERRVVTISWVTLWRIFLFALVASVLFIGLDLILGLFLALVVSSGLEVVVDFLERRGMPRTLAVILIFLLGAGVLALVVYFVIPFILVDVNNLVTGNNQLLIGRILAPLKGTDVGKSVSVALNQLAGQYLNQSSSPVDFFSKLLGGALLAITVLISSFYLSLTKDGVERFIRAVFPKGAEERALRIYSRSRRKIGMWFQSQLLLSIIMAVLVWAALTFLGVKHAFVLGLLAGFLELMPFVGPIISGALAVAIALTTSAQLALYTLVVFIVLQQLEAHFLVPLVTKKAVDLHPVIVIIALLIGLEVDGIMGALVAVPLAAVIQEIVEIRAADADAKEIEAVI